MAGVEVLVVGYAPDADSSPWPITAIASPDIAILRASADELPEIARHARVAMARTPGGDVKTVGDAAALDELDQGARLFVDAWLMRPLEKPDRLGEGLAWDAPGFQPPDPPPERVDQSH